jgi:hypothetical protein
MSSYYYVVFPPGKQPTVDEVREFNKFAGALAGQFAWGSARNDGRLTLAIDRLSFDHVQKIDAGFAKLIQRWRQKGSEAVDHLPFVKNAAALKPAPSHAWHAHDGRESIHTRRQADELAGKELAAKEAIGRSLLAVQQSLDRYAVIQRTAAATPYALMALAAVLTITAGWYIRDQLLNSGRERRQETIERMLEEQPAHTESASSESINGEPANGEPRG